jgi:hypothetical protein
MVNVMALVMVFQHLLTYENKDIGLAAAVAGNFAFIKIQCL